MAKKITIAIDGPAASGKSTTARLLAENLNYIYVDTGAMYRAATLAVLENEIDVQDETAVTEYVRHLDIVLTSDNQTFLNGRDVTGLIRSPEINEVISILSAYPGVRKQMVRLQQKMAVQKGVVMDGRDIGTVVLPNADLKVFMIASVDERSERRFKELENRGINISFNEVKNEIITRDEIDSSRAASPLKKAPGAKELDTSNLSIEEQVAVIEGWAKQLIDD